MQPTVHVIIKVIGKLPIPISTPFQYHQHLSISSGFNDTKHREGHTLPNGIKITAFQRTSHDHFMHATLKSHELCGFC